MDRYDPMSACQSVRRRRSEGERTFFYGFLTYVDCPIPKPRELTARIFEFEQALAAAACRSHFTQKL